MNLSAWIESLMPHLVVAPILLPMLTAALMLLLGDTRRPLKAALNVLASAAGVLVAAALVLQVQRSGAAQSIGVYLPGNWPVPYGIVLVADRLSAMMLLLGSLLGLAGVLYASARWHRAGVHFHPLYQLQLMGLAGAFLTADLFNLFVFFEIMLTASYGLLLHGSGWPRVRAGLHYIAINLMASSLFLIGVAMLYGITGTLNMADMAIIVPTIAEDDRGLLHAGAAILAIAFLVKAAAWPFNAWLPAAYAGAAAPVAALFAVMTKLGVYAILRLWTLLFPQDAGISALFGGPVLIGLGMLTLGFGVIGVIAVQQLGRMAAFCAIVSSGTLLAAIGFGRPAVTGGALYYALGSTLAVGAFFLLVELIDRARDVEEQPVYVGEADPDDEPFAFPVDLVPTHGVNLDDDEEALIGRAIPAAMAFLGLAFIVCALTIAGLPPMAGFVGKVVMLSALLNPAGFGVQAPVSPAAWLLLALLVTGGLLTIIAMSRAGIRC
ncbi:MAG TPA: monovalent cation/H+ antiporter subunit D, partial [Ottowia sp.]|nr:monovalent cation/H+ antiporter subunit D [Ottowia sp.]